MLGRLKLLVGGLLAVAVVAVGTWMVAAQTMRTPAQVAADTEPPEPGLVTAPVKRTTITAEITTRGTVVFDEPTALTLTGQPDVGTDVHQTVVTDLPEPGAEIAEGDVALGVAGRPVLVLAGRLPTYRDLGPGASGDDVAQLQAGLRRLGYDIGEVDGHYGPATEAAVEAWYADAGYEPPSLPPEDRQRLEQAEEAREGAADQFDEAHQQLHEARADGDEPRIRQVRADEDAARARLEEATAELAAVRAETGTKMPAAELEFVDELPRRVDSVNVELGEEASGELLTLTEGEVVVESDLDLEEAELIDEGASVTIVTDEGDQLAGTVAGLDEDSDDNVAGLVVTTEDDAATELVNTSVRLDVPVESTEGEVLAVPVAALSAGGDGEPRVEVVHDDADVVSAQDAGTDRSDTEIVTVEPGLTADGLAEVEPVDGALTEGDQVVVGVDTADSATDGEEGDEE